MGENDEDGSNQELNWKVRWVKKKKSNCWENQIGESEWVYRETVEKTESQ